MKAITAVALALWTLPAFAFPGHLRRIETLADWDSIALGSTGIKHIVPGPSPITGPDGELRPGDPSLACFDFVIYGPGIQHIDILRSTGLDCIEGFTSADMTRMRLEFTQFAGYVGRLSPSPSGGFVHGVTLHNDLFTDPEIELWQVSYAIRQLRLTFNEAALGPLVYLPTTERARERARRWLADPALDVDFEIHLGDEPVAPRFLRGDVNGDGTLTMGDPVLVLSWLFLGGLAAVDCRDAADANDDGRLSLSDAVRVLGYLFLGGPQPPPPFPDRGPDPTADELGDCGESGLN